MAKGSENVYVQTPGSVKAVLVTTDQAVEEGQEIIQLENLQLQESLVEIQSQLIGSGGTGKDAGAAGVSQQCAERAAGDSAVANRGREETGGGYAAADRPLLALKAPRQGFSDAGGGAAGW